jgi:CRP/FNR family transcriptional regulator
MTETIEELLPGLLPVWGDIAKNDRTSLLQHTVRRKFAAGEHVHGAGDRCSGVMLIVRGSLRVFMLSPETGREATLFNVTSGESCVLSASCILSMITFDVFVDAREDTEVFVVDSHFFEGLVERNVHVEAFAYRQTAERFSEVMWVMQQAMFSSLDERLAAFLLDESARTKSDSIALTHAEIAQNLGSAREVISRALKRLADKGVVRPERGCVVIEDKHALRRLVSSLG